MRYWHAFYPKCKKCHEDTTLYKVNFSSDGEVRFIGICLKDGNTEEIVLTMPELIVLCHDRDKQEANKGKTIKPPLATASPFDDDKFLHDMKVRFLKEGEQ